MTLAIISTLVMVLGAETAARALFKYRGKDHTQLVLSHHAPGMQIESRYISHPFLPFTLRPNSDDTIIWTPPPWPELKGSREPQVWHIKTNGWGFRGREVSMEKPPNSIRVICLGGSTTYDTITAIVNFLRLLKTLLCVDTISCIPLIVLLFLLGFVFTFMETSALAPFPCHHGESRPGPHVVFPPKLRELRA